MNKLITYLRDIPSSLLMIIGLTVSYFIIINSTNVAEKILKETIELNNYKYNIDCMIDKNGIDISDYTKSSNDILKILSATDCSYVSVSQVNTFINQELSTYNYDVLLKSSCTEKLYNSKHDNIAYDISLENSGKCIYIGETAYEHFYKKSKNNYIRINNIEYEIIDVLENNMSGKIDNSILIIWNYCTEQQKNIIIKDMSEELKSGFFQISLKNDSLLDETYNNTSDYITLNTQLKLIAFDSIYIGDYQNAWYQFYSVSFNIISLIFSLLGCLVISNLWLLRRKKEIAIRKAFGYSRTKLFILFFSELIVLSIPACVFAAIFQLMYTIIFEGELNFNNVIIIKIALTFIAIFIIVFILVNRILNQSEKVQIIKWLGR